MDRGEENKKHIHTTPDVSHISTPGVAHEESDVEVSGVAWFTVGLATRMVLTAVLMWGMFKFFARTEHRKEPPPTSLTRDKKPENETPELMFPEPRLQQHPILDLEKYRAEENDKLNNYGWVDPATGAVRIPIEEAKKRLLKQGLPYRQAPPAPQAVDSSKQGTPIGTVESKGATAAPEHGIKR